MAEQTVPLEEGLVRLTEQTNIRDGIHKIMGDDPFSVHQLIKNTALNQKTAPQIIQNLMTFGLIKEVRNPVKKRTDFSLVFDTAEQTELLANTIKHHEEWAKVHSSLAEKFTKLREHLVKEPMVEPNN